MRLLRATSAALVAALGALPAAASDGPAAVRLQEELARPAAERDAARLARDLAALGAAALPELFDAVAVEGVAAEEETLPLEGELLAAARAALEDLPAVALRTDLAARVAQGASEAERRLGLALVGTFGLPSDLPLLLELATPPGRGAPIPLARRDEFEDALRELVGRHPDTTWAIREVFDRAPRPLVAPLVRAAGSPGTPEALRVLSLLLGRVGDADPLVLDEMSRLGSLVPHPVDEDVLTRARIHLGAKDVVLAQASIRALGRLEDHDSVGSLLSLLGGTDPGIRAAALDALRRITGRPMRGDARLWERWYADEMRWWVTEADRDLVAIHDPDPAVALRAMQAVASHRLHRHEIAAGLAEALDRPEPTLVAATCRLLARVGSPVPVPELVRTLHRREPDVRVAAVEALRSLTGRELPPDPEAWREVLP